MSRMLVKSVICVFAALSLGACGPSAEEQAAAVEAQTKAAVKAKMAAAKAAAAADPTANMARAVVTGKSSPIVDLKYDIAAKPIAGQPVEIELVLLPQVPGDKLTLAIAANTGLVLSGDLAPSFDKVTAGQTHRTKFTAVAERADVVFFTVNTTLYSAGVPNNRNFAIPIIIDPPPSETPVPAKK